MTASTTASATWTSTDPPRISCLLCFPSNILHIPREWPFHTLLPSRLLNSRPMLFQPLHPRLSRYISPIISRRPRILLHVQSRTQLHVKVTSIAPTRFSLQLPRHDDDVQLQPAQNLLQRLHHQLQQREHTCPLNCKKGIAHLLLRWSLSKHHCQFFQQTSYENNWKSRWYALLRHRQSPSQRENDRKPARHLNQRGSHPCKANRGCDMKRALDSDCILTAGTVACFFSMGCSYFGDVVKVPEARLVINIFEA